MGGGSKDPEAQAHGAYPVLAPRPVGQRISPIYIRRIAHFTSSGQWEDQNLCSYVKTPSYQVHSPCPLIYPSNFAPRTCNDHTVDLFGRMLFDSVVFGEPFVKLSVWSAPELSRPTFEDAVSHDFEPTRVGQSFGPSWSTHWFRVQLTVPPKLREMEHLEFHWDANNEGLIWSADGMPLQGLTGAGERVEWILPQGFRDGKEHTIFIEMACNGMFGCAGIDGRYDPPDPNKTFTLCKADLVAVNLQARGLAMDIWIIGDAARELSSHIWQQHRAMQVANRILDTFEVGNRESIVKCRQIAQEYLGPLVDSPSVYDLVPDKEPQVFAIGHCHIDSCWLWPWAETKRKVVRSWTNQCNLMEQYPELNFACSQAQQYKWLEEGYPRVFERVRKMVAKGRFHPVGGSWVEHDTNMPSGESLVRQFVYGQRYFKSRFGSYCRTFWLPDTFGYSAQLPQLCRLAGMNRFMTQKLSWNNINKFPHTTFNWVALDGSQVVCHMPPAETYKAEAHWGDVHRSMSQHKSMDNDHSALLVFGKGDGGGGPTWQHIEKLRRCRGMADKVGALPRVHHGTSVETFFDALEKKAHGLATWRGELYFELHRGTYTTQANNKRNNRAAEHMLRDIEHIATLASIYPDAKFSYPKSELDQMWEAVLLCQFHDCLPGSGIRMCYEDSDKLYAEVFKTGNAVLGRIYEDLGLSTGRPEASTQDLLAINTLPWRREEIIELPDQTAVVAHGLGPMLAVRPFHPAGDDDKAVTIKEISPGVFVMRNRQLIVKIQDGCIVSLFDRRLGRQVIVDGQRANQYVIFDDKPLDWQAWDVEVYHLDSRKVLPSTNTRIHEDKPHRVSVLVETRISCSSSITTVISLSAALDDTLSQIECVAEVEWGETMKFLKVEFPVDICSTDASYESAFGIVRRPTHYNTSWDMAKFEVCCHRFADLSEHTYGVSILNDSKYGFATCGKLMRLSLLRAPKAPDDRADMGRHTIRWAILPHQGPLGIETVRAAHAFNTPLRLFSAPQSIVSQRIAEPGFGLSGDDNLVLDTVKLAEDGDGRVVVLRIYDALGGRGSGTVRSPWPVRHVFKTGLLEDDKHHDVEINRGDDCTFSISLRAWEVATYLVELKD